MPNDLTGLRVMVTRPARQAGPLVEKLKAAGADPWLFPLLEIRPSASPELRQRLGRLERYHIAIFISRNAVIHGLAALGDTPLPATLQLATVGRGSARELEARLQKGPDICPASGSGSESLLAEPALQNLGGKRILIFRGENGRELLADTLRQRGAQVDYAEVYRRACPETSTAEFRQTLTEKPPDIILISSSEALDNLVRLAGSEQLSLLQQLPLLVIHPRQMEKARRLGFVCQPLLAHDGSDAAIIEALSRFSRPAAGASTA